MLKVMAFILLFSYSFILFYILNPIVTVPQPFCNDRLLTLQA